MRSWASTNWCGDEALAELPGFLRRRKEDLFEVQAPTPEKAGRPAAEGD